MTDRLYTREEMVAAYTQAARFWMRPESWDHNEASVYNSARLFVDGLKTARETAQDARGKSEIPGMVSEDALTLLVAYKADLEHFKLKTLERETALAEVVGELLFKLPFYVTMFKPDAYAEQGVEWVKKMNHYFPELTPEG